MLWKHNYKSMNLDQLIAEKRRLQKDIRVSGKERLEKIYFINDQLNIKYDLDIKEFHNANNSH